MSPRPLQPGDYPREHITGLVLAGGRARRMGGIDKGLVELCGQPMIAHVLAALAPQVDRILVNANRNLERYAQLGHAVVADTEPGFLGPLAGFVSGLRASRTMFLLTVPCDSPLVASDLAAIMYAALAAEQADLAVAHDGRRMQPVFTLLRRDVAGSLEDFLRAGGRKIDVWFESQRVAIADLSARAETFVNVNDPDEHDRIEARLVSQRRLQ